jgi:hypothetical protein
MIDARGVLDAQRHRKREAISVLDYTGCDSTARPELDTLEWPYIYWVDERCKNLSHRTLRIRSRYSNILSVIGPFALEQPDDPAVSVRANAINTTVSTSSDMCPDVFRILQLKQRDAQVFKRIRANRIDQTSFDFGYIIRPRTLSEPRVLK